MAVMAFAPGKQAQAARRLVGKLGLGAIPGACSVPLLRRRASSGVPGPGAGPTPASLDPDGSEPRSGATPAPFCLEDLVSVSLKVPLAPGNAKAITAEKCSRMA